MFCMFYCTCNHGLISILWYAWLTNHDWAKWRTTQTACHRPYITVTYTEKVCGTQNSNEDNFYASAQRSVARGIMVLSCSSVRASVCASRNIVNTISCRVFDTFSPNLYQRCTMGQRWMLHNLGGQRSRWNEVCWKQHILGLLTRCIEKY